MISRSGQPSRQAGKYSGAISQRLSSRWTVSDLLLAALAGLYFAAASLWSLPVNHSTWNRIKEDYARPILKPLGAYQNWSMFAPDPIRIRRKVEARVHWQDGALITLPFPESISGPLLERVRGEQFRKWSLDQLRLDRNRKHWRGAAGRFAREALAIRSESVSPIAKVELVRRWSEEIQPAKPTTWRAPLSRTFVFHSLSGPALSEELRR